MKKILVATDLSARSDRALQRAFALADEHKAELEIVHTVDDELPGKIADRNEAHALEVLDEQISAISHADVPFKKTILRGQDYVEIIRHSLECKADLIVLGKTRHQLRSLFRGTTAERVIRLGHAPVLIAKQPAAGPYKRLVVGVDLSVHSHRALEVAVDFAPKADIYCVHASHEPFVGFLGKETRDELVHDEQVKFGARLEGEIAGVVSQAGGSRDRIHVSMKAGDPQSVICGAVDEYDADLVVTGTHGRTSVAHAFLGSVAEDCLAETPYDVLVAKAW